MGNTIEFESPVERGHFTSTVREQIALAMRRMEGKRMKVKLSEVKRACTAPQKRYYWGVVIPAVHQMLNDAGNIMDAEEVHVFLKMHVGKLVKTISVPGGMTKKIVRSIADTETPEFSAYLEAIWAWAAQMGCDIPSPNERFPGAA